MSKSKKSRTDRLFGDKEKKPKSPRQKKAKNEGPFEASKWVYWQIESYGIEVEFLFSQKAYAILRALKSGLPIRKVAEDNGLSGWKYKPPSDGQKRYLAKLGVPDGLAVTKRKASLLIDAATNPMKLYKKLFREIEKAKGEFDLDAVGRDIGLVRNVLPDEFWEPLVEVGRQMRLRIGDEAIPE